MCNYLLVLLTISAWQQIIRLTHSAMTAKYIDKRVKAVTAVNVYGIPVHIPVNYNYERINSGAPKGKSQAVWKGGQRIFSKCEIEHTCFDFVAITTTLYLSHYPGWH